tara:strand:+ start:82 stop:306 length:225 start_codon:yes stop_codon:yes gene_type:complete
MSNRINIKALNKALIKNVFSISRNAKKYHGANMTEKINEAIEQLAEDYTKEKGPEIESMDDIDLSKVTIIKENE